MHLLIVGGGPAGLTAALLAAEQGHAVTVVEATSRWGGMSASIEVAGQSVDLGSHRLHPSASPQVRGLLERLLGDDLQTRTRNGRIRLGGRWVAFPLSPADMAKHLPPRFVLSALRDAVLSPFRTERSDTYAEVIRAGLGPAVLRWFYGPYAQKLWGRPADELAGDVARRRVSVSSPLTLARKLVQAKRSEPPVFLYPARGYGQVIDELVVGCLAAGVDLRTSVRVIGVDGSAVSLSTGEAIHAERVFWTAGPDQLAAVLPSHRPSAPSGPGPISPARRGVALVYLVLDTDQYTPFDAHYFPGLDVLLARLSEPKNYRDGQDPSGQTILCAEVVCDPGDAIWSSPDTDLAASVVAALAVAGLPDPVVTGHHVERLPAVYPVIGPDDVEPMTAVAEWAQSVDGITVFGRQGLVVADNLHHVMDMAFAAVACLSPDGHWDAAAWSDALDRFDQHIVED